MSVIVAVMKTGKGYNPEPYRYPHVTDSGRQLTTPDYNWTVLVWEAETANAAQEQADRLSSGMINARVCATEEDLQSYINEW